MSSQDVIIPVSAEQSEHGPLPVAGEGRPAPAQAALAAFEEKYVLRLYVTGNTANSVKAIANIKRLCDEHLAGRYEMEVIDIYTNPTLASEDQIVAVPTLVRLRPGPVARLIGDMSNKARVLAGLGLPGAPA